MPTSAVLLVESAREGVRQHEFLIFVKGSCFNSAEELKRELEAFCGENSKGLKISYYAGVTLDEFCDRFGDYLSHVNVFFARNGDELKILKSKFGVVEEVLAVIMSTQSKQEPQPFAIPAGLRPGKVGSFFEDICYYVKELFFALIFGCLALVAVVLALPVILLMTITKYVLNLVEWLLAQHKNRQGRNL